MKVALRLILGTSLVALPFVALAQTAKPTKAPAALVASPTSAPNEKQAGNIIIRNADPGNTIYDQDRDTVKITKDVTVVQTGEDFILYAQEITYNRVKNQAIATGNLRVETRDSTLRGQKIFADFNTKIISLTGNVTITTHGKSDGITSTLNTPANSPEDYRHRPSKILCDRVDWDYDARQGTIVGNIRITQGKNSGTCDRITYYEENNVADLQGNVRFTNDKKSEFRCRHLVLDNDSGRLQVIGPVQYVGPVDTDGTTDNGNGNGPHTQSTPRPTKTRSVAPTVPSFADDINQTPEPLPTMRPQPTEEPQPTPRPDDDTTAN